MSNCYVPILKCKQGEQKALKKLGESVKDNVIPLIEIPFSNAMQSATEKATFGEFINSFWEDRSYFFYFLPEWYSEADTAELSDFGRLIESKVVPLCKESKGIPVFDLSYVGEIENSDFFLNRRIAIRLRNNEFGMIEGRLNRLFELTSFDRNNVDLIFDLQYVSPDDLFAKTSVLKAAFSDLDEPKEYHSIIISCVSYPRATQLSTAESYTICRFARVETEIFALSQKLSKKFDFNYIYSDYGPTNIEDVPFVVGMMPNFKIKYTAFREYLYLKGMSLKKGGLDIEQVRRLAKTLVDSGDFSGPNYSWGDGQIYDVANGITSNSGNLTSWVSYAMNHHITFITRQI